MPIPEYKMGNMVLFCNSNKLWIIRKTSYNPHVTADGYIFGYSLLNCNDGDDSFAWAYEEDLTFVADGNCMIITWLEELSDWTRVIYAGGKNIRQEIEGLQENIKEEIVSQLQKQR